MKHFRWKLVEPDPDIVQSLCNEINVSEPIAKTLVARGIHTFDEAKTFFRPSIENLHSPFLMKGMSDAANRISQAIDAKEKIMIYGDYDVDGTTGTSLLVLFLKNIGAEVLFYVNDRKSEGYGVAMSGIQYAHEENVKVIVSVDCGITAIEPAKFCIENEIDFIICDHHEAKLDRPKAFAILDAKQPDCDYPFKELSGCGVAFKLAQAICEVRGLDQSIAHHYIDFVALAIAADIVDMIGENRILMTEGMNLIQTEKRVCLKAMATVAGIDMTKISANRLVFTIAPRINAAGRLDHAREAIKLLTAENEDEALEFARVLESHNHDRRGIDSEIAKEAEEDAKRMLTEFPSSIVLYKPDWHLGVIGIVASKMVERFYLPTVILTESNGVLKGSVRSIAGVNVYQAIAACSEHLIQFGGHEMAAGLSLEIEKLDMFRAAFDLACSDKMDFDIRTPELLIDSELFLEQITPKFFSVLKQFEPCGPKNMHPLFITKNLKLVFKPKLLKELHLKFTVRDAKGRTFDVIGFGMPDYFELLQKENVNIDLVYSIDENEWNGMVNFQLRLRDLRVSENR